MAWVRDYLGNDKWIPETITTGWSIDLPNQVIVFKGLWKRHIDQLSSLVNSTNMTATGQDYLVDSTPSLNQIIDI